MQFIHLKRIAFCCTLGSGILSLTAALAQEGESQLLHQARQIFKPLPDNMATLEAPISAALVELGRKLFFDPRLSSDGTVSCATCHKPALYGTDALSKSIGAEHRVNLRNAPTVLNAALQFKAHWVGDRASVEEQAMKSLIGPSSFGNPNYEAVVRKITSIPGYSELFAKAFPNDAKAVRAENWGKVIGAYERTLMLKKGKVVVQCVLDIHSSATKLIKNSTLVMSATAPVSCS